MFSLVNCLLKNLTHLPSSFLILSKETSMPLIEKGKVRNVLNSKIISLQTISGHMKLSAFGKEGNLKKNHVL